MRTLACFALLAVVSICRAQSPDVRHTPIQPKPNVPVVVTAKLPVGATKAVLKLQAVEPGKYIRKTDPDYEKSWLDLPMTDDGKNGDSQAGDGVFSVTVPAKHQQHRWLLRYRISFIDKQNKPGKFPLAEDTCPNYAWWCDEGPAAWSGSRDPGKSPAVQFSSEFLGTLQSLHLIAKMEDVAKSQWDGNFHKQKQQGTLVYKGVVYDHIQFSNRGQGSAHISGKNKWGLKFNHGHHVPMVDHDGVPFPATCDSLNLNPGGSTPYLPILRGVSGLDEVLSMRAYRIAGVPSPTSTWIQWRVVAGKDEGVEKDQYAGDLWGLYVAIADMEPKLLADQRLPDGLAVSMQSGLKHTPAGMADAPKVWEKFINELRGNQNEEWCRKNLDLKSYYSFHAINRLVGNVDLRPDGNHGYYRYPDGKWAPIPWDLDMMFVPRHHQPGVIDAVNCLRHPAINIEYQNRAREILDLFAGDRNPKGGQIGQLVADLGSALTPANFNTDWSVLDAAKWNQHPRMNQKGSYFQKSVTGDHFGGQWTRTIETNDFAGFQKYILDFCTNSRVGGKYAPNDGNPKGYGWGYLAFEAKDDKIPAKPRVTQLDGDKRRFEASAFASPANHKQEAIEWRVGRIGKKGWYELNDHWKSESKSGRTIDIPNTVFKEPGEYQVRARWRDATGRCSHWSPAVTVEVK